MPRRAEGPRLILEKPEHDADGRLIRHATWVIRDRGRKVRTGCREAEVEQARRKLGEYLAEAHSPARERSREPGAVMIADVISVYSDDVAGRHARPKEASARPQPAPGPLRHEASVGGHGAACRTYAEERGNPGAARRELEDLRAAVRHYHREGYVSSPVAVTLPDRGDARERWLTRKEAARLIRAAWRMRQSWKGGRRQRTGAPVDTWPASF